MSNRIPHILVTGGGGFLGRHVVKALVERGWKVRTFQRGHYDFLDVWEVEQRRGDLASAEQVLDACAGIDAVVHVAAKAGHWGSFDDYFDANVAGTDNLIAACRYHGVPRLVHTSSPSVVHAGGDLEGVDESAPYATEFLAHYPRTKAVAEQKVLAANDEHLATVALRPHLIWGPGDQHLLPRLIQRRKAGRLRFIGEPGKRIDTVYIDNAVDAHLMALDALKPGAACAGKAYFITNGEPLATEDIINRLLAAFGLPAEDRRIPRKLAWALAIAMEAAWTWLPLKGEPLLTRFLVEQLSTAHWFRIDAARRDFGWTPRVSIAEGLKRLRDSFQVAR